MQKWHIECLSRTVTGAVAHGTNIRFVHGYIIYMICFTLIDPKLNRDKITEHTALRVLGHFDIEAIS